MEQNSPKCARKVSSLGTFPNVDKNQPKFERTEFEPYIEVPTWVSLACSRTNCCGTGGNFRSFDTTSFGIESTCCEIGSPSDMSSFGSEKDREFLNKDKSKISRMAVLFIVLLILMVFIAAAVGVTLSYVHHRDIERLHVNFSVNKYNETVMYRKTHQQEYEAAKFCRMVKDAFRSTGLKSHFVECKCLDTRHTVREVTFSFILGFTDDKETEDMDQIKSLIISVVNDFKRNVESRENYPQESRPRAEEDEEGPVELRKKAFNREGTTKPTMFLRTTNAEIKSTTQRKRQKTTTTTSTTSNTISILSREVGSNEKVKPKVKVLTTTVKTKTESPTLGMNAWDKLLSNFNITVGR